MQAEGLFASQGQDDTFARLRIEKQVGNAGWCAKTQYAEGFVREQIETLPCITVSAWHMLQATGSNMDLMRHRAGEIMLTPEI